MKVSLDLIHQVQLDVFPPEDVKDDLEALKWWLWEHFKHEILGCMKSNNTTVMGKRHHNREEKEELACKQYFSDEKA